MSSAQWRRQQRFSVHVNHDVDQLLPRDARSAKRGIVAVGPPSVRPSVTTMYRGRIGSVTSKVIPIGALLLGAPTSTVHSSKGTSPKFGCNRGGVAVISLKRGKIGPKLLSMTNRKFHTLSIGTKINDLE